MNIDKEKLRALMDRIASEKGDFDLFGLFLRDEAPDKWDLVVSAPWLEKGKLKALSEFINELALAIGDQQLLSLSRVVTLNADDPSLDAVLRAVSVDGDVREIQDADLFGLKIKHAFIFRAAKPRTSPSRAA
jgi:hypothetical protein